MNFAIDWETIEDAIFAWVVFSTGIDPTLVRWEYQGAPRAGEDYIALSIGDIRKIGHDWKVYDGAPSFTFTADQTTSKLTKVIGSTATPHKLQTGNGQLTLASTVTLPAGLDNVTPYFAIRTGPNDIQLAASRADALAGVVIEFTNNGSGTMTAADDELRVRARGMRTSHLLVQGFGDTSFKLMGDVLAGLELAWYDLDVAGVGIGDTDPVQQVPGLMDGVTERRATFGLMLHLGSELEAREDYIKRVMLTVTETTTGASKSSTIALP